jgi:hypothetical protein
MTPVTQGSTFEFRDRNRRSGSGINNGQLHAHTERIPTGRTKGRLSWMGAPLA